MEKSAAMKHKSVPVLIPNLFVLKIIWLLIFLEKKWM